MGDPSSFVGPIPRIVAVALPSWPFGRLKVGGVGTAQRPLNPAADGERHRRPQRDPRTGAHRVDRERRDYKGANQAPSRSPTHGSLLARDVRATSVRPHTRPPPHTLRQKKGNGDDRLTDSGSLIEIHLGDEAATIPSCRSRSRIEPIRLKKASGVITEERQPVLAIYMLEFLFKTCSVK
jgi:hypothetical protein